jgi:hypothetical protein
VDRRTRWLFATALGVLVVLTAGAAMLLGGTTLRDPTSPSGAQDVVGVIVAVDATSLTQVHGFTLRTPGGATIAFTIGQLENGDEFPPGHLVEHQANAQPVRVWYRVEGSARVAIRLEDAT